MSIGVVTQRAKVRIPADRRIGGDNIVFAGVIGSATGIEDLMARPVGEALLLNIPVRSLVAYAGLEMRRQPTGDSTPTPRMHRSTNIGALKVGFFAVSHWSLLIRF